MLKDKITQNTRVTVMGLGLFGGGAGVARFFAEAGAKVTVTDLRDQQVLQPSIDSLQEYSIRYVLSRHDISDFTDCDLLIVNPAVKPDNKFVAAAVQAGVKITTEIGLFIANHTSTPNNKILAVTGSNGKSTTTSLLASILQAHNSKTVCGGNIGGSLLAKIYPEQTPAVLELSSFQLHYLRAEKFAPAVSIITNLTPNHLDWHGKEEEYYGDKKVITEFQTPTDFTVLNYSDTNLRNWARDIETQIVFTSLQDCRQENAAFVKDHNFVLRYKGKELPLAPVSALQLPGEHNLQNALQALTAAYLFTKDLQTNTTGLQNFGGLPHRQEIVARNPKAVFINDSIATTPESTIAALNSYPEKAITLIAGGYDKGIDLSEMAAEIAGKAANAVLIGNTGKTILQQVKKINPNFPAFYKPEVKDFRDIVIEAYNLCEDGIVLLSPGCASYGMFTNFAERGDKFKKYSCEITQNTAE